MLGHAWKTLTECYCVRFQRHRSVFGLMNPSLELSELREATCEKSTRSQLRDCLFPTCQVRVVRFYVRCLLLLPRPPLLLLLSSSSSSSSLSSLSSSSSCSTATRDPQCSLSDLNHDHPRPVFPAGPQPRPSTPSVPCRTSTTTIPAQCVPCRTSTASIPAQCSLPDLNHDHPRPVFPAGPQPRVSTPKDMPHRVPEDMPDRMLEDMPDRMPEGMPDRMPDRMSARMPEDMPDKVPECLPDRMPADLPDNMPEDMLDRMPDGMPEDLPDNMPEDMPDRMPDGMPEDMPEHLPEDMPEHLSEDMPGRMPEDMPDRMPDRMPENMSDRMPEDLPVTKCINVMVGITRSKVIFSHARCWYWGTKVRYFEIWCHVRCYDFDFRFHGRTMQNVQVGSAVHSGGRSWVTVRDCLRGRLSLQNTFFFYCTERIPSS